MDPTQVNSFLDQFLALDHVTAPAKFSDVFTAAIISNVIDHADDLVSTHFKGGFFGRHVTMRDLLKESNKPCSSGL